MLARNRNGRVGDEAGKRPHEEGDTGVGGHLLIKFAGIFRFAGVVIDLKLYGQLFAIFLDIDAASFIH